MTLETLSIDSEDVLGTNYIVTSLTVSNYNPTIDSTVTVTVTLKDVYNDPVVGEEVLVTASDGTFTQLNGSNITAASSVTGTTNNNGQFTLTYSCTEWGLITFSANSNSTQIKVTGIKRVQSSEYYEVYANESTVTFMIHIGVNTSITTTFTAFDGGAKITAEKYRPEYIHVFSPYNNANFLLALKQDGTLERRSLTGSQLSSTIYGSVSFPRRNL